MASVALRTSVGSTGYRTGYTPVEPILGGQLVESRTLGTNAGKRACGVAAAGSTLVAGVALGDIRATAASLQDRAVVGAEHALDVAAFGEVPVTFAAAATRGQALTTAAGGQVTPVTVATQDPRTIIGFCRSDSVAAGAVGMAFIKPSGG
jgi:hypothetical protein